MACSSSLVTKVLVLDEADRILDLGFREQLNSVLQYLPASRQTMLFSATQTKSIKDLARLSLRKVRQDWNIIFVSSLRRLRGTLTFQSQLFSYVLKVGCSCAS